MKKLSRSLPRLEVLEDRFCPALTVVQQGSTLMITGVPANTGGTGLVVQETSQSIFKITDGTTFKGSFPADNIILNLTSRTNDEVTFNLGGFVLPGNLLIEAGLGIQTIPGQTGVGIANGMIGGNVTYLGGSGYEVLWLGLNGAGSDILGGNLSIGGNVLFTPRIGNDLATDEFNQVLTAYPSTPHGQSSCRIGGDLTVVNSLGTFLSNTSSVGGYVAVSPATGSEQESVFIDGSVGKTVTVAGSTGGIDLEFGSLSGTGATIGGSVTAKTGEGASTFAMSPGSTVSGNLTLTSTSGANTYTIAGSISGSLAVNTGTGAASFTLASTSAVAGSVNLTEGNGANLATTFAGTISGNLTIIQGNGVNALVTVDSPPSGVFTYTGGSGSDSLDLEGGAGSYYDVSISFGTGINALTLDSNLQGVMYSGLIKSKSSSNTFTQGADAILLPTLQFINFP